MQSPFIIKADEIEQTKITGLGQSDFIVTAEMIEDEEAESAHLRLVNRAIDDIKNGVMDKVVVSRRISVACNRFPLYAFDFLLAQYANALCYFWYHPEVGCWMGASPELFLSKQGDELLTFSLAGTKAHQDEEEVNWGFKEIEEQEIVTRYILHELSDLGLKPEATAAKSSRAGNLWHLRTEIRARGKNPELGKILNALHPTPAVCGLPKSSAISFLKQYENYDRKFYTGYLGELNLSGDLSCDLFVNLRCMEWADEMAHVYVGGGITAKSNPEAEWMETQYKSLTILNALFNSSK